jgi:hypothetical protein
LKANSSERFHASFIFQKLQRLYKATLKALGSMPGSYPYRRSTEQLINDKLNIIQTVSIDKFVL